MGFNRSVVLSHSNYVHTYLSIDRIPVRFAIIANDAWFASMKKDFGVSTNESHGGNSRRPRLTDDTGSYLRLF